MPRHPVEVVRVYDLTRDGGGQKPPGYSVLVDRLWPRGLAKGKAPFDSWTKEVAPSTALRTWYGHVPERFPEFTRRYRTELAEGTPRAALGDLLSYARRGPVTLVTATKDLEHSAAAVLQRVLQSGAAHHT